MYPQEQSMKSVQGSAGMQQARLAPFTLKESLEQELASAQANVSRLQELLTLLSAHPEVNRIMELLGGGR